MNNIDDSEDPNFITSSFIERDYHRTTLGSHTTTAEEGTPPAPGLERVLKVVIPAEFELVNVGDRYELQAEYADSDPHIVPANEVRPDHLNADERLQKRLVSLPTINGPQVSGSGRQLIDINAPLQASLYDDIDVTPDSNRIDQASELLAAHERDHTVAGSHANTLLHPDALLANNVSAMRYIYSSILGNGGENTPVTSPYYTELYAMVAERRSTAAVKERRRLDAHRRQVAERYDTPLTILEWLRDEHRLSYDTVTELLEPGRTVHNPTSWLAYVLRDLSDGMEPAEIIHHGSYWDHETQYEEQIQKFEKITSYDEINVDMLLTRAVETVSLQENALVKEWWMPAVPDPFPLFIIRLIYHIRDLMRTSQQKYDQPLIPTNMSSVIYKGKPVAGYGYQDIRITVDDPFQQAMSGEITEETLRKSIGTGHSKQGYTQYISTVGRSVLRQQGFTDSSDFQDWLTGAAPTDTSPSELIRWEFSSQ